VDRVILHKQPGWQLGLLELLVIGGATLVCLTMLRPRRSSSDLVRVLVLSCTIYLLAGLFYSNFVWHDDRAWLRALHEVYLTGALALLATSLWIPRGLGLGAGAACLLAIAQRGWAP
jgi:hypothetical protein